MIAIYNRFSLAHGSYLDAPRINFAGRLRVDANTINNMRCNFKRSKTDAADTESNPNSNVNGTNECSFLDAKVTGVVGSNGVLAASDSLIGGDLFDNEMQPFAKMIDLDVDVQGKSVVYGMKVGVRLQDGIVAFKGDTVPSVVSQDYWFRVKCYGPTHPGAHPFDVSFALGAQATTRITNVTWNNNVDSPVLKSLQSISSQSNNGDLSLRLSFYFYTRTYEPFLRKNFTLAYVIGSIGIARDGESLNFGGDRILTPGRFAPPRGIRADDEGDSCHGQDLQRFSPWLFKAPFKVDYTEKILSVDLSNALPVNMHSLLRDIGQIQLGIFVTVSAQYPEFCVSPIGDAVPYLEDDWLRVTSGIVTYLLNDDQLKDIESSKLVIYQEIDEADDLDDLGVPFCGEVFHSLKGTHLAQLLIEESEYFVRPLKSYVERMEYGDSHDTSLLVTKYGFPIEHIPIELKRSNPATLPQDGLTPGKWVVETNEQGIATFTLNAKEPIPYPRQYAEPPCPGTEDFSLPIDGQIYLFKYCIESECPPNINFLFVSELSFLVFSTVHYEEPFTWVEHVSPIFAQYHHLNKAMSIVLDLSDYESVSKPSNVKFIRQAMSLSFTHPNFMPVTRDLSPVKTRMILKWLDNPIYSIPHKEPFSSISSNTHTGIDTSRCKTINKPKLHDTSAYPRCQLDSIPINSHPTETDPYLHKYVFDSPSSNLPLSVSVSDESVCTVENIQKQLQYGIELKLYSISLYLTALYSVVDGCNTQFSQLFLHMAQQEMTHLYNTGLLLYRMGGKPHLTGPNVSPVFPRNGFPGNLLNNLPIGLKKASQRYLYELFMVMNMPPYLGEAVGMDRLYAEIAACFRFMNIREEINEMLLLNSVVDRSYQSCKTIEDSTDALDLINDMMGVNNHFNESVFHQIEELVCEKRLVYVGEDGYAYAGDSLPFNNEGVWPMRENPSWSDTTHGTNCHTRVSVFNQVYRKLMHVIEDSFGSNEDRYFEAIQLMKSLHVHFKKIVWTEKGEKMADENCGPVFN